MEEKNLEAEVSQAITNWDEEFGINNQLIQFYKKSAIFGIRIAIFKVKSKDKKYYEKPFNIDGITPGSYEGIVQVDPYLDNSRIRYGSGWRSSSD